MKSSLKEYLDKEGKLKNLDRYTILNKIPIWRIIRTSIRGEILNSTNKTVAPHKFLGS